MAFLRMNQINRWRSKLTVLLLLHWREGWRGINLRFTSKRRFKFYSVDGILDISALQCERNFTPIIFEVYLTVSHINIFRQTLWQLSPIVSGMINWDVFYHNWICKSTSSDTILGICFIIIGFLKQLYLIFAWNVFYQNRI